MKQVLQDLANGKTGVVEVPAPLASPGNILIHTTTSLISAGTERMLVDFGKASLFSKARQQPDKVRQVLEKVRTDGLLATLDAVRSKLDQPLPLGYCNVGMVAGVGEGVSGFSVGDRVASNGPHAEVVSVPRNLCARIPEGVADDAAAFTVIGAIGLQGVRLAQPTLGECFVVTGLGLIGLMTMQLLRAHGCRVLGIDLDESKVALAQQFGAETVNPAKGEDVLAAAERFSRGRGVDGVLLTLAARSSEPISEAARMCRKLGRIVLVGVTGLELSRADFYEKELTFQVSCSYGPGRYDPAYEVGGHDYPLGFVRWTAQRNFEAVLDMLADSRLDVAPLISHRFPFAQALEAYRVVGGDGPSVGIVLKYPKQSNAPDAAVRKQTVVLSPPAYHPTPSSPQTLVVGFIGAGNYAIRHLLPAFKGMQVRLKSIASSGGRTGIHAGRKFGFEETTTDTSSLFKDEAINTLVVVTRHDSHAHFACRALESGKHVFVEKPLALTHEELNQIIKAYSTISAQHTGPLLMVGFNRRFAPQVQKMKALLSEVHEPKSFIMTVNAGIIPQDHWTQDPHVGGGRIIGESCHFIDLLRFLAGHPITGVQAMMVGKASGVAVQEDKMSFTLRFADGSFGTVHYLANGHKSFPKERLEIFCSGRILQLDNFKRLTGYGWPGFKRMNLWRQNKGNAAGVAAFVEAIQQGKPSPIPFEELIEVTQISFEVVEAAR